MLGYFQIWNMHFSIDVIFCIIFFWYCSSRTCFAPPALVPHDSRVQGGLISVHPDPSAAAIEVRSRVSPIVVRDDIDGGAYSGDWQLFIFNSFFFFFFFVFYFLSSRRGVTLTCVRFLSCGRVFFFFYQINVCSTPFHRFRRYIRHKCILAVINYRVFAFTVAVQNGGYVRVVARFLWLLFYYYLSATPISWCQERCP
jgi:hypothetical protein